MLRLRTGHHALRFVTKYQRRARASTGRPASRPGQAVRRGWRQRRSHSQQRSQRWQQPRCHCSALPLCKERDRPAPPRTVASPHSRMRTCAAKDLHVPTRLACGLEGEAHGDRAGCRPAGNTPALVTVRHDHRLFQCGLRERAFAAGLGRRWRFRPRGYAVAEGEKATPSGGAARLVARPKRKLWVGGELALGLPSREPSRMHRALPPARAIVARTRRISRNPGHLHFPECTRVSPRVYTSTDQDSKQAYDYHVGVNPRAAWRAAAPSTRCSPPPATETDRQTEKRTA